MQYLRTTHYSRGTKLSLLILLTFIIGLIVPGIVDQYRRIENNQLMTAATTLAEPAFLDLNSNDPITGIALYKGEPVVSIQTGNVLNLNGDLILDLSEYLYLGQSNQMGVMDIVEHPDGGVLVSYSSRPLHVVIRHIKPDGTSYEFFSWPLLMLDHTGGAMLWYKDKLLISTGDGAICTSYGLLMSRPEECLSPQKTDNILGKVILLDPTTKSFHIVAMGLRHPWKMIIIDDDLIIFDTGDLAYEMVKKADLSKTEQNFGWPYMEGPECLEGYDCSEFIQPIYSYKHGSFSPPHCSIVGGAYYKGKIVYSDYCSGSIWYLDPTTYDAEQVVYSVGRLLTNLFVFEDQLYAAAIRGEGFGLYKVD